MTNKDDKQLAGSEYKKYKTVFYRLDFFIFNIWKYWKQKSILNSNQKIKGQNVDQISKNLT